MKTFNPRKVRPASATNRFRGLAVDAVGPKMNNPFVGELENLRSTRLREMGLRDGQFKNGDIFGSTIHTAKAFPDGVRLLSEGANLHLAQQYPDYHTTVEDAVQAPYVPSMELPWDDGNQYDPSDPFRTIDVPTPIGGVDFPTTIGGGLVGGGGGLVGGGGGLVGISPPLTIGGIGSPTSGGGIVGRGGRLLGFYAISSPSGSEKETEETPSGGMKPRPFRYREIDIAVDAEYKRTRTSSNGSSGNVTVVDGDFIGASQDSWALAVASMSDTVTTIGYPVNGVSVEGYGQCTRYLSSRFSAITRVWTLDAILITCDLSGYSLYRNVRAYAECTVSMLDDDGAEVSSADYRFNVPVADNVDFDVGFSLSGYLKEPQHTGSTTDEYGNRYNVSKPTSVTVTYEVIG